MTDTDAMTASEVAQRETEKRATFPEPQFFPDEPEGEAGELSGADNMGEGRWA